MVTGPCVVSPSFLSCSPGQSCSEIPITASSSLQQADIKLSQNSGQPTGTSISQTGAQQRHADGFMHSTGMQISPDSILGAESSASRQAVSSDEGMGWSAREEGEGRGPRKEFFALVGAGMTSTSGTAATSIHFFFFCSVWFALYGPSSMLPFCEPCAQDMAEPADCTPAQHSREPCMANGAVALFFVL